MKKIFVLIFSLFFLTGFFFSAQSGQQILINIDEKLVGSQAPNDMEATMILTIVSPNGAEKTREMKAWTKNTAGEQDWRIMKFLSPPDVEDIGFLSLAEDQMYLYLPEFRRIRRIASHNKKESFMGSDFTYEDMGTSGFSAHYTAELLSEDSETWILDLVRKPGSGRPYPKIKMWVDKTSVTPIRLEMFDDSGTVVKETEQASKKIDPYWILSKITIKNLKKNTQSTLEMKDIRVDQNLSDDIFTQRYLQRSLK